MNEQQIEILEKMFPGGFLVIFKKPSGSTESAEACGMFLHNPDESNALFRIAGDILESFDEESD